MNTLIVPCAGRSTRFPGVRPKWLLTYPDGKLMLQKALEGLQIPSLDRTIVTVVREHCTKFDADLIINQALGDDVEICILDNFTSSQSESVALTLQKMDVHGSFISKDSDGYVEVAINEFDNFLVGAELKKYLELSNVAGKSFVILNEHNMVVDIVEKNVCSNIICTGVYGFQSSDEFLEVLKVVKESWNAEHGEIYMSHVASYMIGQKKHFNYKEATGYEDWGLLSDWQRAVALRRSYIVDVDGVIFKNKGRYGKVNWDDEDVPLENNIKILKKLASEGAQIIFCTSRIESQRAKLEASLKKVGIPWHDIVMGCYHSQRVIINDFSNTNPFPSCRAINIQRDGDLGNYILTKD